MKVTFFDKIKLIVSVYSVIPLFPQWGKRLSLICRPLDAPRYTEFAYLQKCITRHRIQSSTILDVSSPYIMSYILSKNSVVLKTDIDQSEKRFIKDNNNLSFKIEDATRMSFSDNTFDLTYSVSVIEHIYGKYIQALQEMIRVTKSDGYVYVTFPVAKEYQEEWSKGDVYEKQHKSNDTTFFQYRFDEEHVDAIVKALEEESVSILHKDIFWERNNGDYDHLIECIKTETKNKYVNFVKNAFVNFYYGFRLFKERPDNNFTHASSCGNMHIVLQKK